MSYRLLGAALKADLSFHLGALCSASSEKVKLSREGVNLGDLVTTLEQKGVILM